MTASPRRIPRPLRGLADLSLALLIALTAEVLLALSSSPSHTIPLVSGAVVAVATLPLIWRRRWPFPVFLVCGAAALTHVALGNQNSFPVTFAVLVGLYSVAAHSQPKTAWFAAAEVALLLPVSFAFSWAQQHEVTLADIPYNYGLFAAAFVLGDDFRQRRTLISQLREDQRLLVEREGEKLSRAREEERAGIARELHDVIAHSVSLMVLQAGAARRVARRQPALAEESLATIETTGREALQETRRLLGLVRAGASELAPQPTLHDLEELARTMGQSGLEVRLAISGTPMPLSPGVELSAFRIVQEALTNTLRHSDAQRADVEVTYESECLRLRVTDSGRPRDGSKGLGHGLLGMRERVALFGGTIRAEPGPTGGWRVDAALPLGGGR
ncbi:MAG: sensor histidine kinase [Candidatus Dormibacteraeota bacterium]|nr:sensor histidine kinase [Candidatus Dormibacteraeota bacterium]